MLKLTESLRAWNTDAFSNVLKDEICSLTHDDLPLQQGLSYSSVALDDDLSTIILHVESDNNFILARVGLFYAGIISGCNCADDPTPVDKINEYCEVQFSINQQNGEATVTLLN